YYGSDPAVLAEREVSEADLSNPRILLVAGLGTGHNLSFFLNKFYKPDTTKHIVAIEKNLDILCAALDITDFSDFIKRGLLSFVSGVPYRNLYNALFQYCMRHNDVKLMAKSVALLPSSTALKNDRDYYVNSVKYFRQALNQVLKNYGNSPEDSLWGLENLLSNIGDTVSYPGIIDLKGLYKGKTAVLVAAGPSLSKNIHLLKDMEDKVFIICVDTALKILLKNNIVPHMVTSIERGISTLNYYKDLEEYGENLKKIYFAPATIVRKEIYDKCVREYGMKAVIVYRNFAHYKWIGVDKGIISSGKSSANLAFNMLHTMGFSKIILAGQDLAFGEEEQTHVSGADHSIKGMKKSPKIKKTMWVEGNYKEKIKTIETWYHFKRYYENDISGYSGTVINATEGGAKIEGAILMPLKKALEKYSEPSCDIREPVKNVFNSFNIEKINRDMEIVREIIEKTISFCNKISEDCLLGENKITNFKNELNEITRGKNIAFKELSSEWLKGYTKSLEKIKTDMLENKMFFLFLMHIVQSYVIRSEITINDLPSHYSHPNEISAAYLKIMSEWFPTIRKLTLISKKHLVNALKNLEKREESLNKIAM
ncbi:MAG: 6-hydroxymethylpterin diphosphokinase MptE-like protein, partial [bacterium]